MIPSPDLHLFSSVNMMQIPLLPVYADSPIASISTPSALPGRHRRKLLDDQVASSIPCRDMLPVHASHIHKQYSTILIGQDAF